MLLVVYFTFLEMLQLGFRDEESAKLSCVREIKHAAQSGRDSYSGVTL
jgi:hypothetical protein